MMRSKLACMANVRSRRTAHDSEYAIASGVRAERQRSAGPWRSVDGPEGKPGWPVHDSGVHAMRDGAQRHRHRVGGPPPAGLGVTGEPALEGTGGRVLSFSPTPLR